MMLNISTLTASTTVQPPLNETVENNRINVIEIIAIIQLVVVFLFGTIGNSLVIFVFGWKKRHRRKRFESLLLLLAITDLFSSVFVPLLFMYGTLTKYRQWHFGYFGCKVLTSLFPITITFSQGILVLISFERYKSIANPFGEKLSKRFILLWLSIMVVAAVFLVSPFIYTLEMINDKMYGINTCVPSGKKFNIIYIYSIGVFTRDFLATLAMTIIGMLTSQAMKKSEEMLSGRGVERRLKNFKTARKMLLVVVVVFSICVLPVDVFQVSLYTLNIANIKFGKDTYAILLTANTFLTILQMANSATNILIYSKMHRDFKRNLYSCVKRSNTFFKGSFSRLTLRYRSESTSSITGDFNSTSNDDVLMRRTFFRRVSMKKSVTSETLLHSIIPEKS